MADELSKSVLKLVTGQICQTIGWHSIQTTPLNILVDLMQRYMVEMGKTAHRYSEHGNRTVVTMPDLARAFEEMGVSASELDDYVQHVESTPLPNQLPAYPVQKDSNLNFLKPGSREVVLRPIYIQDHLPAMYPEASAEEGTAPPVAILPSEPGPSVVNGIDEPSESGSAAPVFKKPEPPAGSSEAANRRIRFDDSTTRSIMREISSVMMTTGGFISPAREGKLPESRAQFWLGKGPVLDDSSDEEERQASTASPEKPTTAPQRTEPVPSVNNGIEHVKPVRAFVPSRAKVKPPQPVKPVNPLFRSFEFREDDGLPAHISPLVPREQKVVERTAIAAAARARMPFKKGPRGGPPLIPPPLLKRPPGGPLRKMKPPVPPVNMLANKKKNSALGMKFSSMSAAGLPKIKKKEPPMRKPRPSKVMNGRPMSPSSPMPALIPKKVLLVDAELSGKEVPPALAPPPLVPRVVAEDFDVKPVISPPIRHPPPPPPPPPSPPPPPREPTPPPPPSPPPRPSPPPLVAAKMNALDLRVPSVSPALPKTKRKRKLDPVTAEKPPRPKKKKLSPAEVPTVRTVTPEKPKTPAVIDMKSSLGNKRKKVSKGPPPLPKGKTPAFIATSSSSDEDESPPSRRAGSAASVEKKESVKSRSPSPPPRKRSPSPIRSNLRPIEDVKEEPREERIPSPGPPSPSSPPSPGSPEIEEAPMPSASLFSSVFSKLPAHPSFMPNFLPKTAPPPFGGPPSFPSHPSFMPFGSNAAGAPGVVKMEERSPSPPMSTSAFLPVPTPPPTSVSRNSMLSESSVPVRPESALSYSSTSRPTTPAFGLTQKKAKDLSSGEKERRKQKKKEKKEKEREEKEKKKKEAEIKKEKKEKKKKKGLVPDAERSFATQPEEQETRSVPKLTLKLACNTDLSPTRDRSPLKSPVPPPVVVPPLPVRVIATPVAPLPSGMPTMPKITIKPIRKPEPPPPAPKKKEPPPLIRVPTPSAPPTAPSPPPVKKKPKKSKPVKLKDTLPKTPAAISPPAPPPARAKTPVAPPARAITPVAPPARAKTPVAPPAKTPGVVSAKTPVAASAKSVKAPAVARSKTPGSAPAKTSVAPPAPAKTQTTAPGATAATTTTPATKPRGRGRPSKSSAAAVTPPVAVAAPAAAVVTPVAPPPAPVVVAAAAAKKPEKAGKSKKDGAALITETVGRYVDETGTTIWICPMCGRVDDGTPMIGCDTCDDWYHWMCVGVVEEPPEDEKWFCPRCLAKERGLGKAKSRKKAA